MITQSLCDGYWIFQSGAGEIEVSESWASLVGLPGEGGVWRLDRIDQMLHSEDRAAFDRLVKEGRDRRSHRTELVFRFHQRNGRLSQLLARTSRLPGNGEGAEDDQADRLLVSFVDITSLRQAEDGLRRLTDVIGFAVLDANDGIWDWDMLGDTLFMSPRFLAMLGYKPNEIPHTKEQLWALMHPEDVETGQRSVAPVLEIGGAASFTNYPRFIHKDGSIRHMICRGNVLRDAEGRPTRLIGWHTDITDRVVIESQLRVLARVAEEERERAQESNRAKTAFLANMSHELRTPLNAVIGFAEVIHGKMDPDRVVEHSGLIVEAGRHLLQLIDEILDYSKIEGGARTLDLQTFDLRDEVRECCRMQSLTARRHGVRLTSNCPDESVSLVADRRAIRQILLNLLSNSMKFSPAGSSIDITVSVTNGWVALIVADHGCGIPAKVLPKLGRPFTQASGDLSRRYGGAGLGLSIVRALAELHGGSLTIDSVEGQGTTVRIDVPQAGPRPLGSLSQAELR